MTALGCFDTKTRVFRRYAPQVHAGVRRARETHAFQITTEQDDTLPGVLNKIVANVYPGMRGPLQAPEAA